MLLPRVYLGQGTLGSHATTGTSAAPQTFLLTQAKYSYSTSPPPHSKCFTSSFHFLFLFFLQEVQEDICKVPLKAPK